MTEASASPRRPTPPITTTALREVIAGIDTLIKFNELKDNTPFRDASADSLDFFNLVIAIEDAYGIKIPSDHLGQVNTLDRLAMYLNERLP